MKNIIYLLRQEFYDKKKSIIIFAGIIFLLTLLSLLSNSNQEGGNIYELITLVGLIFTSLCFSNSMHSKQGQHAWMMLPVHAHEKLISKIMAYSLIFPLASLLMVNLSFLLSGILIGTGPSFSIITNSDMWHQAINYAVASSVFMAGAAYFRNNHFIKTLLFLMTLFLIMLFIFLVFMHLQRENQFLFDMLNLEKNGSHFNWNYHYSFKGSRLKEHTFPLIKLTAFFFCWALTYYKIRKKEAVNAV
jgi:hypothetical protein